MKKLIKEFKEFAMGGNLIDMAVGVIVGGAFNTVVGSLVADIFTPLLNMIFGGELDFSEIQLGQINIGKFLNTIITFLLTALCLFVIVKALNTAKSALKKKQAEEAAAAPPAQPSEEVLLLREIKDILASK